LSNTLFFGERAHKGSNRSATNVAQADLKMSTIGGWAWCAYNSIEDLMLSSNQPINYSACPDNNYCDERLAAMGSQHTGGCNVTFADGSVRYLTLTDNASLTTIFQPLTTRAGGEVIPNY
jgi:prepilin-type processing-associated H-X9-DG protein